MAAAGPQLLLVRHGIAEERSDDRPDRERALTQAGRQRTTAVLERAVAIGLQVERLVASPLLRARQTAEIAVAQGLANGLELATALQPEADPLPLLALWLAASAAPTPLQDPSLQAPPLRLALVGHEPDLGQLAAQLVGAPPGSITLRKAGLALLELPGPATVAAQDRAAAGCWQLRLLLTPRALLA